MIYWMRCGGRAARQNDATAAAAAAVADATHDRSFRGHQHDSPQPNNVVDDDDVDRQKPLPANNHSVCVIAHIIIFIIHIHYFSMAGFVVVDCYQLHQRKT